MSTTRTSTSISATVYLDEDEAQGLALPSYAIRSNKAVVTKAIIRYRFEGHLRGWVITGGTIYYKRVKKNGDLYADEQDTGMWRSDLPEGFEDKYRPTAIPTVKWNETE